MKRIILIGLAAVVVLVAGAAWYLYSSLDSIVEEAIERYGSEAAGARVEVGSVSLSLSEGRGTLRDVRVANPEGFSSADAIYFSEVTLQIALSSLGEDPVVIDEIFVDAPQVRYERTPEGAANLDVIRNNLQRSKGGGGQQGGEPTKLSIRKFEARNGKIEVDVAQLGKEMTAELPAVRISNLGGSEGALPGEIGKRILGEFARVAGDAVARQGIQKLIDKQLGGETGEALKKILGK